MSLRSADPLRAAARRYAEDVARTARVFLPDTAGRLRRACDDLFALLVAVPASRPLALEHALGSLSTVEAEVEHAEGALPPDVRLLLRTRTRLLRRRLAAMGRTSGGA
jgi:hypothetical protein